MTRTQLSGIERFFSLRGATLRTGIFTGVSLSVVLTAWVLVANRVAQLESFAFERNCAAVGALLVLMAVPLCRFVSSPRALFISGVVAWSILTVTYMGLEMFFPHLDDGRMGALQLFILGATSYGLLAAIGWVVSLIRIARHQHVVVARRHHP
ncbi:MAG: hypothetical protein WBF35_13080 [Candidatus Acidiferrales bacterium]